MASDVEGVNNALLLIKEAFLFPNTVEGLVNAFLQLKDNKVRVEMSKQNRQTAIERARKYNNPQMLYEIIKVKK